MKCILKLDSENVVVFESSKLLFTTGGFEPTRVGSIGELLDLYHQFRRAGFEPYSCDKHDYAGWGGWIK